MDDDQTQDETTTASDIEAALSTPLPLKSTLHKRLSAEGRWNDETQTKRDQLVKYARTTLGFHKAQASEWAYEQLDKLYPPLPPPEPPDELQSKDGDDSTSSETNGDPSNQSDENTTGDAIFDSTSGHSDQPGNDAVSPARVRSDEPSLTGLSEIPQDWPQLPPNAALAVEIQWVQANRLRCVTESGDRATVDLTRALGPAPSYATLGWLETSIRAFTKFCDIAAKATAQVADEEEQVRRERMSIDQIRSLLSQMVDDAGK